MLARVPAVLELRAGLPDVAQDSMDTGEVRKGTHTLEMLGENYPNILSPALKLVSLQEQGFLGTKPFGRSVILENCDLKPLLERHSAIRKSVGWVVSTGNKAQRLMPLSEAAFFHYIFSTIDAELCEHFMEALIDGLNLTKQSPVYHLRERLQADKVSQAKMTRKERLGLIIKAWNATKAGEKLSRLVFNMTGERAEAFPSVQGAKAVAA